MAREKVPIARRLEIVDLHEKQRMKPSAIARVVGVCKRTVNATLRRWRLHGSVEDRPRSGRPRKTSPTKDRAIVRRARHHPFDTPKAIVQHLGLEVSDDTVRRRLREGGIRRYVARKTVLMTRAHIDARLQWSRDHLAWSKEQWRRVIWSDERTFRLGQHGRIWVSRPSRKRNDPRFANASESRGPTVMIWARIDGSGKFAFEFVEGTLRKEGYLKILKGSLLAYTRRLRRLRRPFEFMHDRAPPHKAKIVSAWLAKENIPVLPWIAKGADLNPIENLWNVLGQRVQAKKPRTLAELRTAIEEACEEIETSLIEKLIDSIPDRVAQVVQRRGFACDY